MTPLAETLLRAILRAQLADGYVTTAAALDAVLLADGLAPEPATTSSPRSAVAVSRDALRMREKRRREREQGEQRSEQRSEGGVGGGVSSVPGEDKPTSQDHERSTVRESSANPAVTQGQANEQANSVREQGEQRSNAFALEPAPASKSRKRGRSAQCLVPVDFQPTPEVIAWAATQGEGVDAMAVVGEFVDHWRGEGELKSDWQATFKNRIRYLVEQGRYPRLPEPEARPPTPSPDALDAVAARPHIEKLKAFLAGAQRPEGERE